MNWIIEHVATDPEFKQLTEWQKRLCIRYCRLTMKYSYPEHSLALFMLLFNNRYSGFIPFSDEHIYWAY